MVNTKFKESLINNNVNFIGVTGHSTVGKDEVVKILSEIGFKRVSLADPVRQGVYNINPIIFIESDLAYQLKLSDGLGGSEEVPFYDKDLKFGIIKRLRNIVDLIDWDEAKKIPEVRRLLQFYGTEGGREIFGNDVWTDTADKYIKRNNIQKVAVSDVRFPNELDWVKSKKNNLIIKVKRSGIGPINNHSSDLGIADELCDIIINNDGNLEDLRRQLI